jgi:hypothetical protein
MTEEVCERWTHVLQPDTGRLDLLVPTIRQIETRLVRVADKSSGTWKQRGKVERGREVKTESIA